MKRLNVPPQRRKVLKCGICSLAVKVNRHERNAQKTIQTQQKSGRAACRGIREDRNLSSRDNEKSFRLLPKRTTIMTLKIDEIIEDELERQQKAQNLEKTEEEAVKA